MNTEEVKTKLSSPSIKRKIVYSGLAMMFGFVSWLASTVYKGGVTLVEKGDKIIQIHTKLTNANVDPKLDKLQRDYNYKIDSLRGEIGMRTAQAKEYHDVDMVAQNRSRDREIDKMEERMNQRFDKVDRANEAMFKEIRSIKVNLPR